MKSKLSVKKVFTALLTLAAAFMLFTVTAYADDYGNFSYSLVEPEDGEEFEAYNEISAYRENDESADAVVEVPSEIDDTPVTKISASAFSWKSMVKEFIIPDTVTVIENGAFYNSSSLKTVVIPDSVTYIGESAFQGCTSLEYVIIGDGVKEIGDIAFKDCTSLKYLRIGSSVEEIGDGAFFGCTSLKDVIIPPSVKNIGELAFGMTQNGDTEGLIDGFTFYADNNGAVNEYNVRYSDSQTAGKAAFDVSDVKECSEGAHKAEYANVRTATDAYEGLDIAQCSVCKAIITRPNTDIAPEEASASQWVTLAVIAAAVIAIVIAAAVYVKKSKKRRAEAIEAYKAGKPIPDLADKEKADAKAAEKAAKKRAKQEAKLKSYQS